MVKSNKSWISSKKSPGLIYLFIQQIFIEICYVPGTVIGSADIVVSKIRIHLYLGLVVEWSRLTLIKQQIYNYCDKFYKVRIYGTIKTLGAAAFSTSRREGSFSLMCFSCRQLLAPRLMGLAVQLPPPSTLPTKGDSHSSIRQGARQNHCGPVMYQKYHKFDCFCEEHLFP